MGERIATLSRFRLRALVACILLLTLLWPLSVRGAEEFTPEEDEILSGAFLLHMVQVVDPRFPSLHEADLDEITSTAVTLLQKKFGLKDVRFARHPDLSVAEFMARYLDAGVVKETPRYLPFGENDFEPHKGEIMRFLQQWSLEALKNVLKEEARAAVNTYEDYYQLLVRTYVEKIEALKGLTLENGQPLLSPENAAYQSYLNWDRALYLQQDYDMVVVDLLIYYDDIVRPYPHSIFKHAKVGGGSLETLRANPFRRVILLNAFEEYTDIPYFLEGRDMAERAAMRNRILGTVYLAHEIGHAFFLIPDVYDHDAGCLMDGSVENLDNEAAYSELMKEYPPCTKCQQYVRARRHALLGELLLGLGRGADAARHYRQAIVLTPHFIDGDYNSYMEELEERLTAAAESVP